MIKQTDFILKQAAAYMIKRKRKANDRIYEMFKRRVDWIDSKEYDEFIKKLCKVLRV